MLVSVHAMFMLPTDPRTSLLAAGGDESPASTCSTDSEGLEASDSVTQGGAESSTASTSSAGAGSLFCPGPDRADSVQPDGGVELVSEEVQ